MTSHQCHGSFHSASTAPMVYLQEHHCPQDMMGILLVCKRLEAENKFAGINPIGMFLHCLAFIHSGILMLHCCFSPDMIMIYFCLIVGPVFRLWCLKS